MRNNENCHSLSAGREIEIKMIKFINLTEGHKRTHFLHREDHFLLRPLGMIFVRIEFLQMNGKTGVHEKKLVFGFLGVVSSEIREGRGWFSGRLEVL
jgi:hypothetical protein